MTALVIANCQSAALDECPVQEFSSFRDNLLERIARGGRVSALFAAPGEKSAMRVYAVISDPGDGRLALFCFEPGGEYPSLTPDCPQVHWFEREVFEQWGIRPAGHPWLKPVRFAPSRARGVGNAIGITDFFRVEGAEVHEVAVGPVHAGVIEPGHFRFQCHGETVHHLEISLGYQHRGVERALVGGPNLRTRHYMETLSGDTTVGHATAYSQAVEALGAMRLSAASQAVRGIAAELERMANHIGDLGALAGDVGFLPTRDYCGRIRGDVLNMTAVICGNRFGRGLVTPGGVGYGIESSRAAALAGRLDAAERDVESAVSLLFDTPSVLARFEETGRVTGDLAREIGLVGVAARASGLDRDVRAQFPYGIYRFRHVPSSTWPSGDCYGRAFVRWLEIRRSIQFVREVLATLSGECSCGVEPALRPDRIVVSLVEGWRGEICHVALTDGRGRFSSYKVVDPSFHNWFGLACALRGQAISDFPLCNKSFNLSYCGHDL